MGPVSLEKVLEKLATPRIPWFVIERPPEGNMRVPSRHWKSCLSQPPKSFGFANVNVPLHVARKERRHDE
jgi:hypothetical protein